jgi:hypothetical protein
MKKTTARQYYEICSYREDLEYLCDERAHLIILKDDGSKEWSFADGSTIEIDNIDQFKIDGHYL